MTFDEFAQMALEIADLDRSISMTVNVWWHDASSYREAKFGNLTWKIWDAALKEHFEAKTPELALLLYEQALNKDLADLESVGTPGEELSVSDKTST